MAELIYWVAFENDALDPRTGAEYGALKLIQTPLFRDSAANKMRMVDPPGARFTLKRTEFVNLGSGGEKRDDCYVGAVVHAFPTNIDYFKIRVSFEAPEWSPENADEDFGWAMVVFAQDGVPCYWPRRNDRVTVTLQSSRRSGGQPEGHLNAPGGADPGTDEPYPSMSGSKDPIPDEVYQSIYGELPTSTRSATLELLIDRVNRQAKARLEAAYMTPPYSEERWFIHPLLVDDMIVTVPTLGDGDRPGTIETKVRRPINTVGFALANASGPGTASVTVRSFQIYKLNFFDIWFARLSSIICRIIGC